MASNKALRRLAARIEELKSEIERMIESEYEAESYAANQRYEAEQRMSHRLAECRRERQRAEEDARYRDYERQSIASKLENAVSGPFRDSYEAERLIRKLKYL